MNSNSGSDLKQNMSEQKTNESHDHSRALGDFLSPPYVFVFGFLILSVLCVLWRWMPHAPNFSPVLALAYVAGALKLPKSFSITAVFLVMLVSDALLGFHSQMAAVYFSMALCVFLGMKFPFRGFRSAGRTILGLTSASVVFFFVSNLGVWIFEGLYPLSLAGLVECYVMAIPFFANTLTSSFLFGGLFLAAWMGLEKWVESRAALRER